MADLSRRTLALALALTPGIGGKTVARVLSRNDVLGREPKAFAALSAEALREEYRLSAAVAQRWVSAWKTRLEEARSAEARLDPLGVTWITAADAHYPSLLESFDPDPPGVLFLYGNLRLLRQRTFCVLASRGSSPKDLDLIEQLAEEGVMAGETLVSGHDKPEYQRSAIVPLRWGAPRVLVLDEGLFAALGQDLREEPFRAARLWRYKFDPATDLAISTVHPDRQSHQSANRVRDRVVAGLSSRLDFVRVQAGGNMERIAKMALSAGRPVRVAGSEAFQSGLVERGAAVLAENI